MLFSRNTFSKKTLIFLALIVFLVSAGGVMAASLKLQADYNCDNVTDLDDYTVLIKQKRLSTRKLSLLFNEWGKRGLSELEECKTTASTTNTTNTVSENNSANSTEENNENEHTTESNGEVTPTESVFNDAINLNDPELVGYFPMEETQGKLRNKKANNSTADLYPFGNVMYSQDGKLGKGIKVNGVGNAFCSGSSTCSDVNTYDFSGSYTLGMWVKFDSYKGFLFRKWEEGAGSYSYWVLDTNIFIAALSHPHPDWLFGYGHGLRKNMPTGRSYVEGYMDLTKGSKNGWHQFTVVRDVSAKTVKLYVDGVLQDTHPGLLQEADGGTITSEMRADNQNSTDPFKLGELNGTIDEFFVYKRALTQEEIKNIYQSSL